MKRGEEFGEVMLLCRPRPKSSTRLRTSTSCVQHKDTQTPQPQILANMEQTKSQLFQVYLRLRPPPTNALYPSIGERFLSVEETNENELPTHITLNPPNDNRRRAVEKFAFTKVFEEESSQLDLFEGTGVLPLVEGVLGPQGRDGRDGLLATLGVTGSGKVSA